MAPTVIDLRARPAFVQTVADRIWRAWWMPHGHPLASIEARLAESLDSAPMPFCLVACEGEAFLGTASVIAGDLAERPKLTPWVAALWVEPEARNRGVGAALVEAAAAAAFGLGVARLHLCARPGLAGFYGRRGWRKKEEGVGGKGLTLFERRRPGPAR